MKEQLISFETSKLAKEKGFDVICDYVYDIVADEENPIITKNKGELGNLSYFGDRFILSPTQSLLQKWLREVHGLYIEIMVSNQHIPNKGLIYTFIVLKPDLSENRNCINHVSVSKEPLDSYEEALEEGLQEALKLIK